jgi:hypothetical protein
VFVQGNVGEYGNGVMDHYIMIIAFKSMFLTPDASKLSLRNQMPTQSYDKMVVCWLQICDFAGEELIRPSMALRLETKIYRNVSFSH